MISSGGDKTAMANAQKRITNGLIGLVVVIASVFIIELIGKSLDLTYSQSGWLYSKLMEVVANQISQAGNQGITNSALDESVKNLSGTEFLNKLLPNLIGLSFVVGIIIFVGIIIVGAIQWIISGGDKVGIESAKGKITNAVIGIVILFSVFAIISLVENFFGIDIMSVDLNFFNPWQKDN